jgi:hypothetical protein
MTATTRRIDHLVLAVHDLDAAAEFYERIGFQVGGRNRHPWGTENRLVQFHSSFLELITVADGADIPAHGTRFFSFGAFVRDYLNEREGFAMLALDGADASADAADFASRGIGDFGSFSFERDGRRPDGTTTRVGFTLAFARDPRIPGAGFFVCQQHVPDAFWNPTFQQHPNGAVDVTAVVLALPDPTEHTDFLTGFTGVEPSHDARSFRFGDGGRLEVESSPADGGFTAFTVQVPALERVSEHLTREGIPFDNRPDRIVLPSTHAFGVDVIFERSEASQQTVDSTVRRTADHSPTPSTT